MSHDSEESRRRLARENAALAEIGRIIGSSLDIDEVYTRFAEKVRELLPFDRLSIATVDLEAGTLTHAHVAGVAVPGRGPGDVLPLAESVSESSVACGKGQLVEQDPQRLGQRAFDAQRLALGVGLRFGITLPLLARGVVVGTLNLRSKQADAYTEQDLELAERVAAQIAGAVANSELQRSVQRDATVEGVEEAFAYPLLDNRLKKAEFYNNLEQFDISAAALKEIAHFGQRGQEEETELFNQIVTARRALATAAGQMFESYERDGTVNLSHVAAFEDEIDSILPKIDRFVEFETEEVFEAHQDIQTALAKAGRLTFVVVSVAILLAKAVTMIGSRCFRRVRPSPCPRPASNLPKHQNGKEVGKAR